MIGTSSITYPYPTTGVPQEKTCHGCGGRGWVPVEKKACLCPVCNGRGKIIDNDYTQPYTTIWTTNQTANWTNMCSVDNTGSAVFNCT